MSDDDGEVIDLEIEDTDLDVIENEQALENVASDNENDREGDGEDEVKKPVKAKRVIRNPQPKLTAETLKGKRGISALESYFERVKFKGRGHEEQDLGVILKTYEYWCHRLFPKLPFDQCIAKIETLGTKRPVATHVKRIRMNMLHDYTAPAPNEVVADNDEAAVDNEYNNLLPTQSPPRTLSPPIIQPPVDLSEEQMERIRLNKERAERIRREKLMQKKLTQDSLQNSQTVSSQQTIDSMEISANVIDSQPSCYSIINSQSIPQEFSSQSSADFHTEASTSENIFSPISTQGMSENQKIDPRSSSSIEYFSDMRNEEGVSNLMDDFDALPTSESEIMVAISENNTTDSTSDNHVTAPVSENDTTTVSDQTLVLLQSEVESTDENTKNCKSEGRTQIEDVSSQNSTNLEKQLVNNEMDEESVLENSGS